MGAARTFLLNLILHCLQMHYRTGTADQFDSAAIENVMKRLWQAGRLNHHFRTAGITRLRTQQAGKIRQWHNRRIGGQIIRHHRRQPPGFSQQDQPIFAVIQCIGLHHGRTGKVTAPNVGQPVDRIDTAEKNGRAISFL